MVISSTGRTAHYNGGVLGLYEYHEDKGYYVQKSTEQSNEKFVALYLYADEDDFWWVGGTPGQKLGGLHNPRPSKTPPSNGWQYADPTKEPWQGDLTLTVTSGPLPPLPRHFTVTATGAAAEEWPNYLGVFTRTQRWWKGRPVYARLEALLYHGGGDDGWVIAPILGYAALKGSQARHSPVEEDSWRYFTGSEWKPASVTVTGSDQRSKYPSLCYVSDINANIYANCQAQVQVPNPLSQQAPNPDSKVRPSLKNLKTQFFGLG